MATISITKGWADGDILLEADLDAIKTGVETFLNTTKINDDNIQTSGITASSKLIDGSISTAKLADSSITTAKINDLGVTAAKLAADSVTTVKILDANVTKAKLATLAKALAYANKSADYTVTTADEYLTGDTSSATITFTLPAVSTATGMELTVTKTSASNTLVLDGNASETINGSTTFTMRALYESVKLVCTGSSWIAVNQTIAATYQFDPVLVRAHKSGSTALPDSTQIVFICDSEDIDNKSAHNASTGVFTCPANAAGDYRLSACVLVDGSAGSWDTGTKLELSYQINSGSKIPLGASISQAFHAADMTANGSDIVTLAVGDTITFYVYQDSGLAQAIRTSTTYNKYSIQRVR